MLVAPLGQHSKHTCDTKRVFKFVESKEHTCRCSNQSPERVDCDSRGYSSERACNLISASAAACWLPSFCSPVSTHLKSAFVNVFLNLDTLLHPGQIFHDEIQSNMAVGRKSVLYKFFKVLVLSGAHCTW